jgi:hypothetical protein
MKLEWIELLQNLIAQGDEVGVDWTIAKPNRSNVVAPMKKIVVPSDEC